jgi:5-methylcytosine-specific restriction endonuclease McrA
LKESILAAQPIQDSLYEAVVQDAGGECGYCRAPQQALPYRLEIEHLLPKSHGGGHERTNLWLSCHKCNKLRSDRLTGIDPVTHEEVALFNPRLSEWHEHFAWEAGGLYIVGRTGTGRATVATLHLNDVYHQSARSVWIMAGIYPAKKVV